MRIGPQSLDRRDLTPDRCRQKVRVRPRVGANHLNAG